MKRHIRQCFSLCVSAVALLGMPLTQNPHAATRHYDIGDRVASIKVRATVGEERIFTLENPSIVILWSTSSPVSLTALEELLAGAPMGGIRWQIVPINVDAPSLNTSDTARVNAVARKAGWNGQVWHDQGYRVMDDWGVFSLPTVVFTSLGGRIDEIEHDWSPLIRVRLFALYFGAATDSFPGMTTPIATETCRYNAEDARRLWRMGKTKSAIARMRPVVDSCAGLPSDVARFADWVWSTGDSVRQRDEIERFLREAEQSAWTLCGRAGLAQRRGDCSLAVTLCRQSTMADSAFFPAWIQLAESARLCGDSALAVTAYNRARLLNRLDPRVLAFGAHLAEIRGEREEAARFLRAAVEARLRIAQR